MDSYRASSTAISTRSDLVAHVSALNAGRYTPPSEGRPTDFTVGVAGYAQKHFEAPNLETDMLHLKEKIDAGASFVITQMVFEARQYAELVRGLDALGIKVPIVPGIKPVLRASSLASIPRTFFVDLPQGLIMALSEARSPTEERTAGIELGRPSRARFAGRRRSLPSFFHDGFGRSGLKRCWMAFSAEMIS